MCRRKNGEKCKLIWADRIGATPTGRFQNPRNPLKTQANVALLGLDLRPRKPKPRGARSGARHRGSKAPFNGAGAGHRRNGLMTPAFLWVTVAPYRSQTPAVTTEAEEPPQYVKNVMAELSAPLALVKHAAGHLSTPPIQVLGPNAHRVAVVFITPARAAVAVAAAPQEPEIGGAAIVLTPLSGQTAFLDERAKGLVGCR
jgi:hypothetical protein